MQGPNVGAGSGMPPPRAHSSVMAAPRRSPEELQARVQSNIQAAADLHMAKTAMSNQNFKNTRVTSTKAVLMKNGKAVCIGFTNPNQRPVDPKQNRSSETTSFSS